MKPFIVPEAYAHAHIYNSRIMQSFVNTIFHQMRVVQHAYDQAYDKCWSYATYINSSVRSSADKNHSRVYRINFRLYM